MIFRSRMNPEDAAATAMALAVMLVLVAAILVTIAAWG